MIFLVVNRFLLLPLVDKLGLGLVRVPWPDTLAAMRLSIPGPTQAEARRFMAIEPFTARQLRVWRRQERNHSSFHHASASWQEASPGAQTEGVDCAEAMCFAG